MPSRRVLIVEDNPDNRDALKNLLELFGHSVEEAGDGARAVELAMQSRPEVAVIDVGLPGLDGYEVAQRIRSGATGRQPFLIALTGYGRPEDRRRAREAGFDAHLLKPVDGDELERLVATGEPEETR